MPHRSQTGGRIRAMRTSRGLSQQDLARRAGISPSYLNLIEHDRRRIGGRVLTALADALGVGPGQLTEPVDATLLDGLSRTAEIATEPVEALVESFPGWARIIAAQTGQIARRDARISALTQRLAHDPLLAGALHQVLSTVTSIRSTASILVDGAGDREWEARFHQNIHADSLRLAEVSQSLVAYLEGPAETVEETPEEQAAAFFEQRGYHFSEIEAGGDVDLSGLNSKAAEVAQVWLARYRADARALPLPAFAAAAERAAYRPDPLVQTFAVGPEVVMRRLASLPSAPGKPAIGLAMCDGAGVLTFVRQIPGFVLPGLGGGCPLWPLYRALGQLGRPLAQVVAMPGTQAPRLSAYAVANVVGPSSFTGIEAVEAVMLVVSDAPEGDAMPVGPSCGLCPRESCGARRQPGIVPAPTGPMGSL